MFKRVILGAVAASFVGVSAWAGGLSDAIVEAAPEETMPMAAEGSGSGWIIPLVIAGILIAVAIGSDDGEEEQVREPIGNDRDI